MSNFGAYYKVDPDRPTVLLGKSYENVAPVGAGVSYFLMDKDLRDDSPDGTHGMSFDLSQIDADMLSASPVIAALMFDQPIPLETLSPIVSSLVQQDLSDGLTGEQVLEKRAAILIPQFLAFTYEELKETNMFKETTNEEGVLVPNLSKCSWESL